MHDGVAERLRSMVFERDLAPGELIDEVGLAARWKISRTPLREALKVLAAEGLVELEPRRGSRVVALKNVSYNEPIFQGHFPEFAIFPGVMTIEALAQAQRLAVSSSAGVLRSFGL